MTPTIELIDRYTVKAKTVSTLHIGTGDKELNGILVHPVTDMPFIQASSLAGVLRSASENVNGTRTTSKLFGSAHLDADDSAGDIGSRVRISDGVFDSKTIKIEYRPRVKISRKTGSVSHGKVSGSGETAGHKFDMEMIGAGAELFFTIYLSHNGHDCLCEALENVLAECSSGRVRFGGQKSNGSGILDIQKVYRRSFVLTDEEDRIAWSKEKLPAVLAFYEEQCDDPACCLLQFDTRKGSSSSICYEMNIAAKTEGALLVKGISADAFGPGAADAENMRNTKNEYIVPGSSLKGALRNRMELLAGMLGKQALISLIFGKSTEEKEKGRGNLLVQDVVVCGPGGDALDLLQHRIHVDKFTGGVIHSGLFAEKTVSGNLSMHIDIENRNNPDATAGLLVLALRDLAAGVFNLGSGYSVGRGFIQVDLLQLKSVEDGKIAEIDFHSGTIKDADDLFTRCLQAVENWEEG